MSVSIIYVLEIIHIEKYYGAADILSFTVQAESAAPAAAAVDAQPEFVQSESTVEEAGVSAPEAPAVREGRF